MHPTLSELWLTYSQNFAADLKSLNNSYLWESLLLLFGSENYSIEWVCGFGSGIAGLWFRVQIHYEIMSKQGAAVVIQDNPLFGPHTEE